VFGLRSSNLNQSGLITNLNVNSYDGVLLDLSKFIGLTIVALPKITGPALIDLRNSPALDIITIVGDDYVDPESCPLDLRVGSVPLLKTFEAENIGIGVINPIDLSGAVLSSCRFNNCTYSDIILGSFENLRELYIQSCKFLTHLDLSNSPEVYIMGVNFNPELVSADISNMTGFTGDGGTGFSMGNNPKLATITAVGFTGCTYSTYGWITELTDNALTTDAVYNLIDDMAINADPVILNLSGNPCDGGAALTEGLTRTGAETEALALSKNITIAL